MHMLHRCLALASKQRPCPALLGRRGFDNGHLTPSQRTVLPSRRLKSTVTKGVEAKQSLRASRRASAGKDEKVKKATRRTTRTKKEADLTNPSFRKLALQNDTTSTSPLALKLSELQHLASTIGVSQTAPKSALTARILDAVRANTPLATTSRILSLDLGIRNLAYALLSPGSAPGTPPTVHAWDRVDLRSLLPTPTASSDAAVAAAAAQDFSPGSLSSLALELVLTRLVPLNPTHVLIERQRFRSGGGAAVLEWTVRVNSLESMLYAVFATLQALGRWEGRVIPVDPRRVGPFLVEDERAGLDDMATGKRAVKGGRLKKGGKENKRIKIDLVGSWVRDGRGVDFVGESEVMKRAFLRKWLPRERKKKSKVENEDGVVAEDEETIPKLDDVADCLLQGVAWLRWEDNKRRLAAKVGEWL